MADSSPLCQFSHVAAQINGKDITSNMELNIDIVTCILECILICWYRHVFGAKKDQNYTYLYREITKCTISNFCSKILKN